MTALAEDPRPDDPYDVRRARNAPGLLRAFNDIGVLAAADVHVAARLTAITGETDATIALAAALAVRAPRLGHVFVDLATIRETATVESDEPVDLTALPWPDGRALARRAGGEPARRRRRGRGREPAAAPGRHLALSRPLLA